MTRAPVQILRRDFAGFNLPHTVSHPREILVRVCRERGVKRSDVFDAGYRDKRHRSKAMTVVLAQYVSEAQKAGFGEGAIAAVFYKTKRWTYDLAAMSDD